MRATTKEGVMANSMHEADNREYKSEVVTMSSKLVRSGGPVIRGNIVGRIRRMARGGIWATMRV